MAAVDELLQLLAAAAEIVSGYGQMNAWCRFDTGAEFAAELRSLRDRVARRDGSALERIVPIFLPTGPWDEGVGLDAGFIADEILSRLNAVSESRLLMEEPQASSPHQPAAVAEQAAMSEHETAATVSIPAKIVQWLRRVTGLPWMECKACLVELSALDRERIVTAIRNQSSFTASDSELARTRLHDPIEDDPEIRPRFLTARAQAEREAEESLAAEDFSGAMGTWRRAVNLEWRTEARTKEILREQGVEWRDRREMNPWCRYFMR